MYPSRAVHAALVFLLLFPCMTVGAQQGLNNLWMGGYESTEPTPLLGGVDLDFNDGTLVVSSVTREIDFKRTNTNITDSQGNLLFSTNGAYIANASGFTMMNGGGLNPSWYTSQFPEGLHISQNCLILPKPEATGIYYLFHGTIDDPPQSAAQYLYLSIIDMDLDGGMGGVVSKNQILIDDFLNQGKITAVRHANGRDWWVFCHRQATNIFYRLLLTPDGVSSPQQQAIGIVRNASVGQVSFSPDGSRFAYYWGDGEDLEILDFDRCTGLLSNPIHILINDQNSMGGVAFSPNSQYLYVSSVLDVYQFDTQASNVAASMVHIAEWDGFYSPSPPFATVFDIAQLAPDGKIYIGTGNSTLHLHVIHEPDQPGFACSMEQHGIELPRYFMNSLPNHPNYHLGPLDGSVCDSLGITVGVSDASPEFDVTTFPNPGNGLFNIHYAPHSIEGSLEIFNSSGKLIAKNRLAQWTTLHQLDLNDNPSGMYHCRLQWGSRSAVTRFILHTQE